MRVTGLEPARRTWKDPMLPITSHTHLMAEGVRVELTRLLHSTVFKTAPVAGFRVDLPNLAVGEGLEPSCPFQDYSLAGCRFYHSPTLLLTLVLSNGIELHEELPSYALKGRCPRPLNDTGKIISPAWTFL